VVQTFGGVSSTTALNFAGNELANTLIGNAAGNVLNGREGNDLLLGMGGNDTLVGGANNDIFVFNTALNATTNVDTINDFSVPNDTIRLENAIFSTLSATGTLAASAFRVGTAAADANDHIIYDAASGVLIYDSNGSATGGAARFAFLAPGLALTNADFVVV
jgi:Ca2+-binding RTX toxin-like protein